MTTQKTQLSIYFGEPTRPAFKHTGTTWLGGGGKAIEIKASITQALVLLQSEVIRIDDEIANGKSGGLLGSLFGKTKLTPQEEADAKAQKAHLENVIIYLKDKESKTP